MLTGSRIDGQADVCKRSSADIIQVCREFQPNGSDSKVLQKLIVPVIDQQECREIYARYLPVTSNMLCAGEGVTDTCQVCFQCRFSCLSVVPWIFHDPLFRKSFRIPYHMYSERETEYIKLFSRLSESLSANKIVLYVINDTSYYLYYIKLLENI